ncbi:DNA polymerase IV [Patescibacteria group bacterium]|nr:DNA polymerase IV [Patescibacteria group bacterium]
MDSFFASCEQQRDPKLRGVPVCIGQERGIATAMSSEAKSAGVTRGMRLADIKKVCPECIILPSDYETFGLYSLRLFEIVRKYSDDVEEYSIDEAFADITGMRRSLKMTYEEIITQIKYEIDTKMGTVCSIGLAPSKTLAKIASKWQKPNGLTIISGKRAQYFLKEVPIGKVWGIGDKTEQFLTSKGIHTALQFAYLPEEWITRNLTKPHYETWCELRGQAVKTLQTEPIDEYHTISKTKTFTPASNNQSEVFSRLCKNVENACRKARRYGLVSKHISFGLKTQNFIHHGRELKLQYPTADPITFIKYIEPLFSEVFSFNLKYRTTHFSLHGLAADAGQLDLFGNQVVETKRNEMYSVIDKISAQHGKHTVHLGISDSAIHKKEHESPRSESAWRKKPENWLPGETARRRVNIPYCGFVR